MIRRLESGIASKGLGFDYLLFIRDIATQYGLVGVVFEKSDGSIKLIAEGEEEDLNSLLDKLENESRVHSVENFYIKFSEPTAEFEDFSILAKQPIT